MMLLVRLPVDVTCQPPVSKLAAACLARPVIVVLFSTTSGTDFACVVDVDAEVDVELDFFAPDVDGDVDGETGTDADADADTDVGGAPTEVLADGVTDWAAVSVLPDLGSRSAAIATMSTTTPTTARTMPARRSRW